MPIYISCTMHILKAIKQSPNASSTISSLWTTMIVILVPFFLGRYFFFFLFESVMSVVCLFVRSFAFYYFLSKVYIKKCVILNFNSENMDA